MFTYHKNLVFTFTLLLLIGHNVNSSLKVEDSKISSVSLFYFIVSTKGQKKDKSEIVTKFVGIIVTIIII